MMTKDEVLQEVEFRLDLAGIEALKVEGKPGPAEPYWLGRVAALDDLRTWLNAQEG